MQSTGIGVWWGVEGVEIVRARLFGILSWPGACESEH